MRSKKLTRRQQCKEKMGNQLVAVAPAQIFPVEHYMSDLADLTFDTSLGSTRFMKVARARGLNGLYVVKVFTIQDASIDLRKDLAKLAEIKKSLQGCLNCLPFQRSQVTERAAFVVRQFFKDSFYDRVSTRPFLTMEEKKWMAFQLLLALKEAHRHGVCHGDIKMENLMVTSWNWVVLCDFASFKPTFLPEDNPADFSYFFDTSRRRTCYIAPERFKTRTIEMPLEGFLADNTQYAPGALESGDLTPAMDIFSAGCVLIELFTDGSINPFSFSQLLAYRAGEYEPNKVLDKIEDEEIKRMVTHMIQKDPNERWSAHDYLTDERGKSFPNYFYTFMASYMKDFASAPAMTPDQRIDKVYDSLDEVLEQADSVESDFDSGGLVLICSLITSNVRSLKFAGSKVKAMLTLGKIAGKVRSEIILDRILPYVMTQLSDRFPSVRIAALCTVIECTRSVSVVPLSDANIFPEYILPTLMPLCHDRNDLVRAAFASNISVIATESVRFLDIVILHGGDSDRPMPTYENELNVLHDLISQAVSVLLADSVNSVKQALMENSVTQLAVFFGKPKANDIILSHMITFLNDKDDSQLRISFYENIVGVASFVGHECSPILLPLLQQGLSDPEEFVVSRCIGAMASLTQIDLLQKAALYELLKDTTPYLLHPNLWIRQATAGFLSAAAKHLDTVDTMVKLGNIIEPYLNQKLVQLDKSYLILANIQDPVPRQVYDAIIRTNPELLAEFLDFIEKRRTARSISKSGHHLTETEISKEITTFFRRLTSEGMTPVVEDKVLSMKEKLLKISRQKNAGHKNVMTNFFSNGILDLSLVRPNNKEVTVRLASLSDQDQLVMDQQHFDQQQQQQFPKPVNEEWNQMFGAVEAGDEAIAHGSPVVTREARQTSAPPSNGQEKLENKKDVAPCQRELNDLVSKKKIEFGQKSRGKLGIILSERLNSVSGWRPKGILVAHLHEHQGGITKIVRIPERSVFASASVDGCVRLWDCMKFEGSNLANKAHKLFNNNSGFPLTCMAVDAKGDLLATGAENGSISIFRLDGSATIYNQSLNIEEDGPPIEFSFLDSGASPLLVYATAFGGVVGLDYRQQRPAFKVENDLRDGIQTAFAVSPGDQCWAVSGSSSGVLTCWDLRFLLPIVKATHPAESRIRSLCIPQRSPYSGSVLASVQGNNEVGLWNLESQFRQLVLWASSTPLLASSAQTSLSQSISAIHSIHNSDMNVVLTAGTDMRIRYWNLKNPSDSYIVAGGASEVINPSLVQYRTKLVDGTEVIQEIHAKPKTSLTSGPSPGMVAQNMDMNANRPGLEPPSQGHLDWVSSLALCQASHWYVVTGSKDGVIKVWK